MAWVSPVVNGAIASATVLPSGLYSLPTTTNLQLWLNAQTGVTLSGSTVTQWDDNSANARNAVSRSGTPQLVSADISGYDSIAFTNDSLSYTAIPGSVNWTVFVVALVNSDSFIMGSTAATSSQFRAAYLSKMAYFNGSNFPNSSVTSFANYSVLEWVVNGTTIDMFQDGTNLFNGAISSIATSFSTIGEATASFVTSNFKITDLIVYSSALSSGDRSTIRSTLGSRYGITVV